MYDIKTKERKRNAKVQSKERTIYKNAFLKIEGLLVFLEKGTNLLVIQIPGKYFSTPLLFGSRKLSTPVMMKNDFLNSA